jgi:hypothetical protein
MLGPLPSRPAPPGAADADLRTVVEDLQREVALLRRKLEVQEENQARTAGAPVVGAGADGFSLRSPDKAFEIKLRGYTQFDGRTYTEADGNNTDTWLSGLGVGFAFDYGATDGGGSLPTYTSAGQATFFQYQNGTAIDGNRLRYSPQLYYYCGPFGLLGEYVSRTTGVRRSGNDAELRNSSWQLAASWALTGENASYLAFACERTWFQDGAGTVGDVEDRDDESVLFMRTQLSF